jgi:hypothetical protein
MLATNYLFCRCYSVPFGQHADLTENKVRLGLPRIIQRKENAPEFDYSSFYVTTGMGYTGCLVAQDLALLTNVRTLIHEEISLLTVLYFPFRARTPLIEFWSVFSFQLLRPFVEKLPGGPPAPVECGQ